jgi:ubiquinone biosynthesis protein
MRSVFLVVRAIWIGLVLVGAFIGYGFRRLFKGRMTRDAKEALRGKVMASTFERLGATFVKFGQILSTRPDLLGPGYIEPLSRLQDRVKPEAPKAILKVLARELPGRDFASFDIAPIASASVAQVHRARLPDGTDVAVKIQRPGVERRIIGDCAILAFWAKCLHVLPSIRPLSLPGAVAAFAHSLEGQLDFRQEALNNRRFAANFEGVEGIGVPRIEDAWSTGHVLTMEFIDGVKGSQPERVGGDRPRLARLGANAILKMIFVDGFVHADLHPGNIILTSDGRVVMIDLGMVAEIPKNLMRPWIQTFTALGQQNAAEVARLLYVYSPSVGRSFAKSAKRLPATNFSYDAYEADVLAWFAPFAGKRLGEVEASVVLTGVLAILRKYRIRIDPSFTVVHIAMLVAEGLGKQLDPTLDIVQMALPILLRSGFDAGPGLEPRRPDPRRTASDSARRAA